VLCGAWAAPADEIELECKRTPSSAAYLSTRQRQDARWEWDCRLTGRDRRRIGNAAARVHPSIFRVAQKHFCYFFSNYTLHQRHSQHAHTHPYEYIHVNPTHRSIFGDCVGKSSRLTKSPQAPHCRRERRLPLKAQTSLNSEKFASTRSRTQDLRGYRSSCATRLHALSPHFCYLSRKNPAYVRPGHPIFLSEDR
jgi:hypothetical protein